MTTASPAGDPLLDRLLPLAGRLIGAAHEEDALGVHCALHDATDLVGDQTQALRALVVLLAAMCDDDATPAELLQWRRNRTEYHRLRSLDVPSRTAAELAARVADFLHGRKSA